MVIQESHNLSTLKLEDLVGSLEAHEFRIIERKDVQYLIHALQIQTWNKHASSNKFKGKGDKTLRNKSSWLHSQKQKADERTSGSSKRGEGTSDHKDKLEKKSVKCYNYEKWGHLAKNYEYKKGVEATKDKDDEGENLAHEDSHDSETMVLMATISDEHVDSKT